MFYYAKNIQGNKVKILDEDGNEKASYVYNAWGNILSQSEDDLSSINPLRYRGYVYDEDTTLYYLQTRYYDPTTGRFINADTYCDTGSNTTLSNNVFSYCENNPINFSDYNGCYSVKLALNYAKKWCKDRNPIYKSFWQRDCANFVSQCLYAGKFSKMYGEGKNSGWHNVRRTFLFIPYWDVSKSWSSVTYLIAWLINRGYVRHNIFSVDDFNKVKPHIKKGNVVILSSRYDGNFNHAVLVGDITKYNIYYYAHTEDRSALDHSYGLMDYFFYKEKGKNGKPVYKRHRKGAVMSVFYT